MKTLPCIAVLLLILTLAANLTALKIGTQQPVSRNVGSVEVYDYGVFRITQDSASARLATYIFPAPSGEGQICMNLDERYLVSDGDTRDQFFNHYRLDSSINVQIDNRQLTIANQEVQIFRDEFFVDEFRDLGWQHPAEYNPLTLCIAPPPLDSGYHMVTIAMTTTAGATRRILWLLET